VAYIGSSNVDLGKSAGKLMLQALPSGGKCIGFVGLPGADNARERIEGVKETIKGSKVELIDVRGDEIDQGRAKRNVEDALAANPDIACLVGFYSYNTPRIYEVLKETGKLGKIKDHRVRRGSDHAGRREGRQHRRHGRAAAVRVGLPGHEADGGPPRRRQVRRSEGRDHHRAGQGDRQDERRRIHREHEADDGQVGRRRRMTPLLELAGIRKRYPGVLALDGVNLSVFPGEVVGLVGENGAGKSTLMKVLGGVLEPDAGVIRTGGVERRALSVQDAMAAGIAFVHQELNLFENLDVAANVFIGREVLAGGFLKLVDTAALRRRVQPLLDRLGCDFGPDAMVESLSLAQRQLVEIAKALSLEARLVIMDEPTSSLTIAETERLLRVIAGLKADGVSVIFISHRLGEVERCADRVVVLRDGSVAGELDRESIGHAAMIRLMIGRELKGNYTPPRSAPGDAGLEVIDVRTRSTPARRSASACGEGEILGLAGLVGSGRTELARALFGIDRLAAGTVRVAGRPVGEGSPRAAIERGLYLVPEDRKRAGLLLDFSVAENISLPDLRSYAPGMLVATAAERSNAQRHQRSLDIRVPDVATAGGALSGGNQQKVVLAKWLSMRPRVIILDEPTRGIDVGSKNDIYGLLRTLADSGVAILLISSDMEEVIGVCDRIAVMHEGGISGILERPAFSEHNVLRLAVGARPSPDLATETGS
jgi:ribose transport system ATP-binding protein